MGDRGSGGSRSILREERGRIMPDWEKIKGAYEVVKAGVVARAEGPGYKVYSMGQTNPVIRIDVKEGK